MTDEKNGYLTITRKEGERYYLVLTEPAERGTYIEVVQCEIRGGDTPKSKHAIKAPKCVKILREEITHIRGGLESVIKKNKA